MEDRQEKFIHSDLTETILKCSFEVINTLGIGFLETVYKNSLQIALLEKGLKADPDRFFEVVFHSRKVGIFVPDLIVENAVLVELKACERLLTEHQAQLINYLAVTNVQVGLLVNFGKKRLEYKRVHHPTYHVNRVNPVSF